MTVRPSAVVGELLLDRLLQRDASLPAHLRDADDGVSELRRDAERLALVVGGDGVEQVADPVRLQRLGQLRVHEGDLVTEGAGLVVPALGVAVLPRILHDLSQGHFSFSSSSNRSARLWHTSVANWAITS